MKPYQFLPLLLPVLFACNRSDKEEAPMPIQAPPTIANMPNNPGAESFDSFNTKFHTDSTFQLSRIPFPIDGQSVNDLENTKWSKRNWEFLKTPVSLNPDTTECRHSLSMTDSMANTA
jgi:hypothetical protein